MYGNIKSIILFMMTAAVVLSVVSESAAITPVAWKQSNANSAARAAGYLSSATGMDVTETYLYNQDGLPAGSGQSTTADYIEWLTTSQTSSGWTLASCMAAGKVWIVADLGAVYDLSSIKIWNFNWDNTPGSPATSLNNRGISQFDVYVRNSAADTDDGTVGGTAINLNNTSWAGYLNVCQSFNLGTANPWQLALENQTIAQAPNADDYAGLSYNLSGTGRFVAIVADSSYGGAGVGLGKVKLNGQPHFTSMTIIQTNGSTSVSESSGLEQDSFHVRLDSQPTHPVQITVHLDFGPPSTAGAGDIQLVGANGSGQVILDFSTSNWQDMQTVTVEAIQDQIYEATETAAVTFQVQSDDPAYDGILVPPVGVSILDDDEPVIDPNILEIQGITAKASSSLSDVRHPNNLLNNTGMDGEYLLNLDGSLPDEPTSADNVSWVTVSGGESTALAANKVWVVFDLGGDFLLDRMEIWNWQWHHSSLGDLSNRGVKTFDIYSRMTEADTDSGLVTGTEINLDAVGTSLSSAAVFNLGAVGPWEMIAANQPLAKAPDNDQYESTHYNLSGRIARFVAISARDYYGGNGVALGKVKLYGQPYIPLITTVQTNGFTSLSESSGLEQDSFQVKLNSQPTHPVQITVQLDFSSPSTAGAGDIQLVGANPSGQVILDFSTSDWQDMQTVTVEAIQDQISEATETAAVTFQVQSEDTVYGGVSVPPVGVSILDDDEPGVVIIGTGSETEVWEKDQTSDTYQVRLQLLPSAPVTIRIEDVSEPNQVTVSPAILQFDPSNWDQAVTVTVSAIADGIVEKDIHTTRLRHSITSQDLGYQNLLPPELTVLVRDGDCNPDTALAMDMNKDCRVDIEDFALLAFNWMACTLPGDQDCIMTDQQHSTFFVSTDGDDSNPGTIKQPFATLEKARDAINDIKNNGWLAGPVTVYLRGGTYRLQQTFLLEPQDSGNAKSPILYMSFPGEHAVLSGGVPITGTWQADTQPGVWYVDVPGVTGGWNFRQLFVNGTRAIRARYPNASESNPFLYATGGNMDYVLINPSLVKASWGTAADAQINIVPQSRFFNQWNTVTAVNTSTGRIDIADSERHRTIDSGSWFWIEGVRAELDQPGEWFLDQTAGRLYYMPQPGVNPNTLSFVAPLLNKIIYARGDVNAGTHVEYVNFKDLEFQHTTFTLGQIEARVDTDGAIMFENTCDSSVKNCRFENIGGYALWLHLDSNRNIFDRNTVLNSGAGGVLLTGSRFSYMDDTKIYTPSEAAAKVAPILNEITRNTVEHCGKIRYYGGGVHMDSRPFNMSMAPGNYIAHNHFSDLSRNGIFAFRNQGGNVVEYNHIHNVMQTTVDAGGIHFATMNRLNAPNFILNNWLYDIWGYEQKPDGNPVRRQANGVYLDWDTSNTTVKDNWIYNYAGNAVAKVFGGNWNVVIADNQSSATPITPPFVAEVGPDGTATHGIDMDNNKLIGSVIHYTDTSHFDTTGTWIPESKVGRAGLFVFNYLVGTSAVDSQARYTLPITEDGTYQISLLYSPGSSNASNAPITIEHADGTANISWNMQQGNSNGFAVAVGTYRFETGKTATVTLSTTGANGKVVADSVGFVKISE